MRFFIICGLLLISFSQIFADTHNVTLFLNTKEGVQTMVVDSNIMELRFEKSKITGITGLEKLEKLETVVFDMTAFIKDFSFLSDITNLKKAVFVLVTPNDWNFISLLINLEILSIRNCNMNNYQIDLQNNENLRYVEICYANLSDFSTIVNEPESLEYMNLSFNDIRTVPDNICQKNNRIIFLYRNPITGSENKCICFGNPAELLPAEYIISDVSH